jgi:excisionase family DNA binding protein
MPPGEAHRTIRIPERSGEMTPPAPAVPTRTGPKSPGSPREWLSRTEVARLFQVSASTVTRWAREGKVPARRTPGGHYRYPEAEVRRLAGTSGPGDLVRLD